MFVKSVLVDYHHRTDGMEQAFYSLDNNTGRQVRPAFVC